MTTKPGAGPVRQDGGERGHRPFSAAGALNNGAEAPAEGWYGYATGFALSTALLHAVGIAIGFGIASLSNRRPAQIIGAVTAALGIFLMIG